MMARLRDRLARWYPIHRLMHSCCEVPVVSFPDGDAVGGKVSGCLRVDGIYIEFEGVIVDPDGDGR